MLLSPFLQNQDQVLKARSPKLQGLGHVETKVQGHLIVTAAPGMQLFPGLSDQFGQPDLNVHMHVFQVLMPDKYAGHHLFPDPRKTPQDRVRLGLMQNPLAGQHPHMGHGPCYILFGKPAVKVH